MLGVTVAAGGGGGDTLPAGSAFEVTLEAMEEFTIDYLEHNLRIKIREGRTYNFTDEQDNADALLVFHREVENARRRLASGDRPVLP